MKFLFVSFAVTLMVAYASGAEDYCAGGNGVLDPDGPIDCAELLREVRCIVQHTTDKKEDAAEYCAAHSKCNRENIPKPVYEDVKACHEKYGPKNTTGCFWGRKGLNDDTAGQIIQCDLKKKQSDYTLSDNDKEMIKNYSVCIKANTDKYCPKPQ